MKATNIKWDIDYVNELDFLPTEMEIPKEIGNNEEDISNYLSDTTGFCHEGFVLEK